MSLSTPNKHLPENILKRNEKTSKIHSQNYRERPSLWRIIFLLSTLTNYFLSSFSYLFTKRQINGRTWSTILILDVLYAINYLTALINFFLRSKTIDLHLQLTRNKFILIIDFFLAFPYSYIYETVSYSFYAYYLFLILRANVLLRLFHLVLFFKEQWNSAGMNQIKCFSVQYMTYFLLLVHTVACYWYLLAFAEDGSKKSMDSSEKNQQTFEKYVTCVYYALMSVTNRHLGDFVPGSTTQRIFSVVFICMGFILSSGVFISVLSFLLDVTYKRRTKLKIELQNILNFLKSLAMHQKRITSYYKFLWEKKRGVEHSSHFEFLPNPLKYEISVDTTIGLLQTSTLFQDKPDAFLRVVSNLVKHEMYQPGSLIYHRNCTKNKMIFVVVGTIDILSSEDDESPIISFNRGTCLGESSLILTLPSKNSIQANSYTELQVLYRKDFFPLIEQFPLVYADIRNLITQRVINTQIDETVREGKIQLTPFFPERNSTATKTLKENFREKFRHPKQKNPFLFLYQLEKSSHRRHAVCLSENFPWILHPNGSVAQFWEIFIVMVALYTGLTYPYYIVFVKDYPTWLTLSFHFVDLLLILDVLVILTTGIEENDRIISTFMEISQKRLTQTGFYLDFISSVKIELFYWIWTRNSRFGDVLRLNRLLKMYRITKLLRKVENKIETDSYAWCVIKYMFYILFFGYLFGAFFYVVTCFENICTDDGWFFKKMLDNIEKEIVVTYTPHEVLTSVYYALSCLTGLTPGDILPTNTTDMITTSFVMICGIFTFGCCVAQSSALLTRKLKVRSDFQDTLHLIVKFMKSRNMGKDLIRRVKNYLVLQWHYDQASVLKNQPLFFNLDKNTQTRIHMDEKMDTITKVALFHDQRLDFLLSLATNAHTLILPPNEFVTYKGEVLKILYIIEEGYCIRQFEKSYVLLRPLSFFGTLCLFSNVNSLCTVKTLTHVKMLCITEDIFWKSASSYPTVFTQFKATSEKFNILSEFKKIPLHPMLDNTEIEEDSQVFEGSFINVISYCKQHEENYSAPFRELGILCWIQMLMLPTCILPYGSLLKLWMTIRLVFAILTTVLTPCQIIQAPYSSTFDSILFIADITSYIDLYVMLFVGYYGDKNQLITHPLKTAAHYLKSQFMLNFALCFPWELLLSYFFEYQMKKPSSLNLVDNLHNVARIIRMGQIYRLVQFFNYISYTKRKVNSNILQVLKYLPMMVIFVHFWATILVVNSCKYYSQNELSEFVYNASFVQPDGLAHHSQKPLAMYCNEDSWFDRSRFRNFTEPHQVYILAVYYCTGLLTLCGLGDITPKYPSTLLIVIATIMCGVLFTGYIYAKISSHKAHWYNLLFKNQEMITELHKFMTEENVQEKLQHQVIERFEYRWKRSQGVEPNKILTKLHPLLYQDIVYSMFENTLINVPIFENVDKVFLRVFGRIIKERYYLRQETIYKSDDVISDLCIIERGVVRVVSKTRTIEALIENGGIFGNLTPAAKHKISITVTALSNVDLLVMNSQTFYDALEKYPSIKEIVEGNFTKRTDFIIPSFKTADDITHEEDAYPETKSSVHSFRSLADLQSTVAGFLVVCLPWKLFHVAVPQYSVLLKMFDVYCLIITYLSSVFATYEFAFQDHALYLLCFAIYADITFIVKIILEMHKTYENRYGEMVTSNQKIIKHYFHKRRIKRSANFFINIPFYYLVFLLRIFTEFDTRLVFSCTRLIVVLRLCYFFDYYTEKFNELMNNSLLLKISATCIWGTLTIHFFACGWYLCACPLVSCLEDSWIKQYNTTNIHDWRNIDKYITCIYFVTTLLTKTGTGDIVAVNIQEQVYISLTMISAIFLIGIFIGEIWNVLNSTTVGRVKYDYRINELKQYVKNNKISKFQMKKLWRYVRQLWFISSGHQIPQAITHLHSPTVQQLMSDIYLHHLKNSYIFSDVQDAFCTQVCQYFKRMIFFPGNYIVQHGDFDNTMYFIHYGEVDILSVHSNLTESIHEILHNGDTFGVIQGLYHNVPHHFSFRARTTVHVLGLRLSDWEHLLLFFPPSKESIFTKTNKVNV